MKAFVLGLVGEQTFWTFAWAASLSRSVSGTPDASINGGESTTKKFGCRTLGQTPYACIRVLAFLGLDLVRAG
jgi:hypothetical protein